MKTNFQKYFALLFLLLITLPFLNFYYSKKLSLDGIWRITEVQTVKPDGNYTKVFPKESQVIFSKKNYSFLWTTQISKNRNWAMTDSLKLDRFNQSIVNAGTFDIKNSVLTTKATFAMNPMFVNGEAKFKISFKKDTLVLKGLSVSSSENISHPVYKNGSYFVTKLVKISN